MGDYIIFFKKSATLFQNGTFAIGADYFIIYWTFSIKSPTALMAFPAFFLTPLLFFISILDVAATATPATIPAPTPFTKPVNPLVILI